MKGQLVAWVDGEFVSQIREEYPELIILDSFSDAKKIQIIGDKNDERRIKAIAGRYVQFERGGQYGASRR